MNLEELGYGDLAGFDLALVRQGEGWRLHGSRKFLEELPNEVSMNGAIYTLECWADRFGKRQDLEQLPQVKEGEFINAYYV